MKSKRSGHSVPELDFSTLEILTMATLSCKYVGARNIRVIADALSTDPSIVEDVYLCALKAGCTLPPIVVGCSRN